MSAVAERVGDGAEPVLDGRDDRFTAVVDGVEEFLVPLLGFFVALVSVLGDEVVDLEHHLFHLPLVHAAQGSGRPALSSTSAAAWCRVPIAGEDPWITTVSRSCKVRLRLVTCR